MNDKPFMFLCFGIIFVALIAIGGWKLERWLHYKLSYETQVQEQIQKAIKPLEDRIKKLEKNK